MSSLNESLLSLCGSTYCVLKAALNTYLRILALETRSDNIAMTILKPARLAILVVNGGFIDTPISQHIAQRPFMNTPERGAELMVYHIACESAEAFIPGGWPWAVLARILSWAPGWLIIWMTKRNAWRKRIMGR
ncbi:hypothetical protein AMAG_16530 [Allomyces macrogynus ATCC 38327]|uniref:Uncharacterized protein n=1 Tax=Allomyces macrogynus (strain ATCC 38327) TaxID=578462 RepID=A0A0L0TCN1_ALLM3|nr:hypothetical protein AMAG_16530 [Allomyces macrogynus ATCC 38327]|eukprot:KNE72487.1 hypothetical protein AMAG_16530 [Allomyces macrogynus ATCC 38327]